jgi:SNF2 family DNA or RNA helicase
MLKIHVLVTTYEALIKDYEEIAEIPWRTIVVDEAHRLRNWKGPYPPLAKRKANR